MKRLFFTLCVPVLLLCSAYQCSAQYVLTAIAPPPQFGHDDLWNLSITRSNMSDGYTQFYIALRIFNANSVPQLKTNSATLSLNNALTLINIGNINDVKPFTMNYYNATVLQQVIASGGLFPAGEWNVDFTLYGRPSDGEFTELANYNYVLIVDAIWPPMLLSPADGDTVQTPNPILTWTPAFSTYMSGSAVYTLRVVPIYPGQSKQQAIGSNFAAYQESNIPMPLQIYPNTAQPLDSNERYAWQVQAFADGSSLGQSEVWEFCYCFREPDSLAYGSILYRLTDRRDAVPALLNISYLPLTFNEEYRPDDEVFRFTIRNSSGEVVADEQVFEATRAYGQNVYVIDLCSDSRLDLPDGYYLMEVYLTQKGTLYFPFILQDRTPCNP